MGQVTGVQRWGTNAIGNYLEKFYELLFADHCYANDCCLIFRMFLLSFFYANFKYFWKVVRNPMGISEAGLPCCPLTV